MPKTNIKDRLQIILSISTVASGVGSALLILVIWTWDYRYPAAPELHHHIHCSLWDTSEWLADVARKPGRQQIAYWTERYGNDKDFEHVRVSQTSRWIITEDFCKTKKNQIALVTYKGKLEPIVMDGKSKHAESYYRSQLEYVPAKKNTGKKRDYSELAAVLTPTSLGLGILCYLFFGGLRLTSRRD